MGQKRKIISVIIIFLCITVIGYVTYRNNRNLQSSVRYFFRYNYIKNKLKASPIKIGMTRAEVEKIFQTKDGGLGAQFNSDNKEKTSYYIVYFERPAIKIKVPYYGYYPRPINGDMESVVNGPIEIYKENSHSD